jgi:nitroreductase
MSRAQSLLFGVAVVFAGWNILNNGLSVRSGAIALLIIICLVINIYNNNQKKAQQEDLLTLVKAGMQARACGNQEAREFIIVTRDDLVKAISHNSLVAGPARKAGAAIVIVGKKEDISFPEEWSFDCAAAAENILIEAEHLGLGSIWLQVYPYADRKAHLLNILDIPAEMEPFCIIAIGYAERKPVRMNRYNERIIYNDLYGSHKK